MRLPIIYAILALIATATNIGPFALVVAIIIGIGVGLIVEYVLDKRYIFSFRAENVTHDSRIFALYSLMRIVTTAIFLDFEFGFNHLFQTKEMSYLGGAVGLAIGYWVKYRLDKHYVFRTP